MYHYIGMSAIKISFLKNIPDRKMPMVGDKNNIQIHVSKFGKKIAQYMCTYKYRLGKNMNMFFTVISKW